MPVKVSALEITGATPSFSSSMTWDEYRHFHRQPAIVAFWRRLMGPILPWLTPVRRRLLLALGAGVIAVTDPLKELRAARKWLDLPPDITGAVLTVITLFAFVWACYRVAARFASLPGFVRRHPQLCLHGCFWAWMIVVWNTAPSSVTVRTVLAGCTLALPLLLWRLGFMLFTAQRGKMAGTAFRDHWFYLWPVWGGTSVPYGKGLDYLKSCEAKDEEALARAQLSGIKLFLLAALCGAAKGLIDGMIFGEDNIYRRALGGATLSVARAGDMMASPGEHAVWKCWVSIYCELFRLVLGWGSVGHAVIGYLRLGGFHVFRNTYKPLLAETIVEFWNRYYYYFKELLVHFFFFPVFTRYFKQNARLRMAAAVFAAAFFGNMYYHLIKAKTFLRGDWAEVWAQFNPRLIYCFVLALGIFISMQREQKRMKCGTPRSRPRRTLAIFGVWTFFAFIHLWARSGPTHAQRFHFVLGLFGFG